MKPATARPRRDLENADTEWSDPGSTRGIPDRWQTRSLGGLWLTVGHNARTPKSGYCEFVVPIEQSPWKVYGYAPDERAPCGPMKLTLVASGTATSLEAARSAAESAARAWKES